MPLGLPKGSIRAIIALGVVGTTPALSAVAVIRQEGELAPVLGALYALCGNVIPSYFQTRKEAGE